MTYEKKWRKRWCHESDPWGMMIGDERSEYSIKRSKGGSLIGQM